MRIIYAIITDIVNWHHIESHVAPSHFQNIARYNDRTNTTTSFHRYDDGGGGDDDDNDNGSGGQLSLAIP